MDNDDDEGGVVVLMDCVLCFVVEDETWVGRFVGFFVVDKLLDAGILNVVSSWTDWNVCNFIFSSEDVGIFDVILFRIVVCTGTFSIIGCSLLDSVLP